MRRRSFVFAVMYGWMAAVPAAGMELGGFDVEIGTGENEGYPSDWWGESQPPGGNDNSSVQDAVPGAAGDFADTAGADTWTGGAWTGEPAGEYEYEDFGTANGGGENASGGYEGAYVYEDFGGESGEGWNASGDYGRECVYEDSSGESGTQDSPGISENNFVAGTGAEEGAAEGAGAVSVPSVTVAPTVTVIPTTAPSPAQVAPVTAKPTPTPTRKAEPVLSITPVPSKMRIYAAAFRHKSKVPVGEFPEIEVISGGCVQILSLRVNGQESLWKWRGRVIVPEVPISEGKNEIRLLAVTQSGELAEMEPWIFSA